MRSEAKDAVSLVPEIYYDLIARIMPGCAIITGAAWLAGKLSVVKEIGGVGALVLLVMCYLAGVLVTPMGRSVVKLVDFLPQRFQGWFDLCGDPLLEGAESVRLALEQGGSQLTRKSHTALFKEYRFALGHFLHEYVKKNKTARTLIPKMRAEMSCCRNLTAGGFLLSLTATLQWLFFDASGWKACSLALLTILSAFAARYRAQAHNQRLVSFLDLIHKEQDHHGEKTQKGT